MSWLIPRNLQFPTKLRKLSLHDLKYKVRHTHLRTIQLVFNSNNHRSQTPDSFFIRLLQLWPSQRTAPLYLLFFIRWLQLWALCRRESEVWEIIARFFFAIKSCWATEIYCGLSEIRAGEGVKRADRVGCDVERNRCGRAYLILDTGLMGPSRC